MLYLGKKAFYGTKPESLKKKFGSPNAYYEDLLSKIFDWEKLSKNGTLFDPEILKSCFEQKLTLLDRKRDYILIELGLTELARTGSIPAMTQGEALLQENPKNLLALHIIAAFDALGSDKSITGVEMRLFHPALKQ